MENSKPFWFLSSLIFQVAANTPSMYSQELFQLSQYLQVGFLLTVFSLAKYLNFVQNTNLMLCMSAFGLHFVNRNTISI